MSLGLRERLARLRGFASRDESPRLSDESRWYTEHTALLISTLKWALLGAAAGVCVGLGTRVFLWALDRSADWARALTHGRVPAFVFLPVALPICVWMIRTFSADARGHGTEAVIAAVHQRSGRVDWLVAPVKLAATVVTLAFGGSVGKEGPAAQIGAALTSLFADILRLRDEDRRRLVICGISAGFAAVFGTPVSGALFGIEVLYLGRIDYTVIFPALVAGIVAHLVCGVRPPFPALQEAFADTRQAKTILIMLACGALFGLIALLLIESLRFFERTLRRFERRPYLLAAAGGVALVLLYLAAGDTYAGLGTDTINGVLAGTTPVFAGAFLLKILATSITLETGGSGGIVTPIFFVGATSGAALGAVLRHADDVPGGGGSRGDACRRREHADCRRRHGDGTAARSRGRVCRTGGSNGLPDGRTPKRLCQSEDRPLQIGRARRGTGRSHRRRQPRIRPYPQGQSDRTRTPVRPSIALRQGNRARRLPSPDAKQLRL